MSSLATIFEECDATPRGFRQTIDLAGEVVEILHGLAVKAAESPELPTQENLPPDSKVNPYLQTLGGMAQLWEAPQLSALPQHPSSLGQMLVLGGLGALAGNQAGKAVDRFLPNDYVKAQRVGTMLGGLLGASPGLLGAYLNWHQGKPVWTSSFYQTRPTTAAFEQHKLADFPWGNSINVQQFQDTMWRDQIFQDAVPLHLRAAASGLVQQAANLPDKRMNSPFVTPLDIARVAIGAGSGLASGWLVGKTLGAVFGTGEKTQKLLRNSGMAIGALKAVIPLAFSQEPYGY